MTRNVFAVYDLSSSSVAGAHILRTDTTPVMLASARRHAQLQGDLNVQRFVEEEVKHLSDVITKVKAKDLHHPSHIQVILASPWYSSQTRTIVYKKEKPFVCTTKLIDQLVEAEIERMLREEVGSFGVFGSESVVVEKQISAIKLNGYQTSTPYGKHASTIELFLSLTIAPKPVLDRFTDTLRRAYGTRDIAYTTSPFAAFVVMRDLDTASDEGIIIDIGEEITDVAFIKSGTMLYQHSFPVGTFGLYRELVQGGSHTITEAMTMLETYRLGKLTPAAAAVVDRAITTYLATWQTAFREVLEGGRYGFCLPSQCVVSADPKFEQLFTQVLTTDEFIKHRCAVGETKVTYLSEDVLGSLVRAADHAIFDTALATGALYTIRIL